MVGRSPSYGNLGVSYCKYTDADVSTDAKGQTIVHLLGKKSLLDITLY